MASFTESIDLDGSLFTLQFSEFISPAGKKYFVTMIGSTGLVNSFEMKEEYDGRWKIIPPMSTRLKYREGELSDMIARHERDNAGE